ncbi:MAG: PAS domain-containing sensor histidine kinase, partial [Promethearchaeota archaeon]
MTTYIIMCVFIGYVILKYKFFDLHFKVVSDNIIENISECLFLTDEKGVIKDINNATINLLNYKKKELLEKHFSTLLYSIEDLNKFQLQLSLLIELHDKDGINDIEMDFITKNGNKIPISLSGSIIKNKKNIPIGIIFIGRDITERKQVEEERKRIMSEQKLYIDEILKNSHVKSKFLSSMSHELRTPLNSIIGFSELLLEGSYGNLNSEQYDFLKDIKVSSEHLLDLINNLLDISKIEAGELKLNYKKIQLKTLINQIHSTIKPLYFKKGLYFKVIGLNDNQIINADPVRIKEILYNLLSNAIKFTNEGGITLQIIEKDSYWYFNISDTGIGIEKEDYDIIFKEFKTIKQANLKKASSGTGLGLPLTKRLVELHGGNIYFTSKIGHGSTFTFSIPKFISFPLVRSRELSKNESLKDTLM